MKQRIFALMAGLVLAAASVIDASAAGPVAIAGLQSSYSVNPSTQSQTITISISLSSAPGNDVTVRSTLDGTISGITIKSGASLVFSPTTASLLYSKPQSIVLSVAANVAVGQTSVLTLQGSGIKTATTNIQVTSSTTGGASTTEDTSIGNLSKLIPGSGVTDVAGKVSQIIGWFFAIIALLAFVSLLYSGFMYITSGGDASQAEKARKNIAWAVTGIVIALLSYLIVTLVPAVLKKNLPSTGGTTFIFTPNKMQSSELLAKTSYTKKVNEG